MATLVPFLEDRVVHVEEKVDALELQQKDLDRRFAEAFPGGDHLGHCRYHQLMIEDIESRKRLTQALKEHSLIGVLWAILIFVGTACWLYLKSKVGAP